MSHITKQNLNLRGLDYAGLRRTAVASAITLALGGIAGNVTAALPNGAVLNFIDGAPIVTGCTAPGVYTGTSCTLGGTPYTSLEITDMGGSYFTMDQGGNPGPDPSEKTAVAKNDGIIIGTVQPSSGQHTGAPDGTETPGIDKPWGFFGNTGMHATSSAITEISDLGTSRTLDFSGWGVNWGDFGPGGLNPTIPMPGVADLTCTPSTCADGSSFVLDMAVHVPVAFSSVPYTLHMEGTVSLPGAPPATVPDSAKTIAGNAVDIDVLANDSAADGLDTATVAVVAPGPTSGAAVANPDGTITYTPNTAPALFTGMDAFDYTVDSLLGVTSPATAVDVDVQTNVAPVAVNDSAATSSAVLGATPLVINVLSNDTDSNNNAGLPGGIDPSTLTIVANAGTGTCVANANGTITYTQPAPVVGVSTSCTYKVSDIDTFGTPLESNVATVSIEVTATQSDWPVALDPDIIPLLAFEPGVAGDPIDKSVPAQSGSYFTMQVTPTTLIYTVLEPGPAGGLIVGHEQPAGNSHSGEPTGVEEVNLDQAWSFFTNTGFDLTKNGGITGNSDGTLQFGDSDLNDGMNDTRWIVTWNGIPEIDLGGDTTGRFPEDLRYATISCTPAPCADQSAFVLDYAAHVPPGDVSGFGGVPYTLKLLGTVKFLDGAIATSNGTVVAGPSGLRVPGADLVSDPDVEVQCVGDCFDYEIQNVTDSRVSVVLPLAGGVPENPVWRVLENGAWRSFDTSAGDSVTSAAAVPGVSGAQCPAPGDAAYGDLTIGHACVQISIADNGLNDKDPAVGTISDPSGMGAGGAAGGGGGFVDTRTSDTSGCTILAAPDTGPLRGGEWWLLAGAIAWLGLRRKGCRYLLK